MNNKLAQMLEVLAKAKSELSEGNSEKEIAARYVERVNIHIAESERLLELATEHLKEAEQIAGLIRTEGILDKGSNN